MMNHLLDSYFLKIGLSIPTLHVSLLLITVFTISVLMDLSNSGLFSSTSSISSVLLYSILYTIVKQLIEQMSANKNQ